METDQLKELDMEFKDSNWVHYPGWVVNDDNLSLLESIAYSTIYGFSQDGKSMYMGTAGYLAKPCKCSREHMTVVLGKMVKKGYLKKINHFENGESRPYYMAVIPQSVIEKSPLEGDPNGETKSKAEPETSDIKPSNDNAPKAKRKSRKEFVPPTREEVLAYMKEKDLHFDVNAFFRWYEKSDWIDAKGKPVSDWKGRCRAWDLREFNNNPYTRKSGTTSSDSEQMAEIANNRREDDGEWY